MIFRRNMNLAIGATIVLFMLGTALLSLFYTPYDPNRMDIAERLQAPNPSHPLGTDQYGRDIISRMMRGTVTSIVVGWIAVERRKKLRA